MNLENNKLLLARNPSLDILRTIGTLLIILAHVGAPKIVNEVRCFDVILLVFISGYCINFKSYGQYLWKRFMRLVVPAWVLLVILFCTTWIACVIVNKVQIYNTTKIIKSFFFLNGGIGFIWIVRIYLGIAVLSPVMLWVNKMIKSNVTMLVCITLFILLECYVARRFVTSNTSFVYYIVEILAYSVIALIGYRLKQVFIDCKSDFTRYNCLLLFWFFTGTFLTFLIFGFEPNEYKYPPLEPYLFYGLSLTVLIYVILSYRCFKQDTVLKRIIVFFSMASYDIYLVHIFALSILDLVEEIIKNAIDWKIKYFAVLLLSIIGSIIIVRIKKNLRKQFVRV